MTAIRTTELLAGWAMLSCGVRAPIAAGMLAVVLALRTGAATGDTHYVDTANTWPASPFTNWSGAATSIQEAIDAATHGDTVCG